MKREHTLLFFIRAAHCRDGFSPMLQGCSVHHQGAILYMGMHDHAPKYGAWSTARRTPHFFLPPAAAASSFRSHEMTFPSITTPLPSMKATRERPSQFLKVSHTRGCCGWKLHCAISLDLRECGSSIFLPPVSLPIFHLSFEMRQAERPQRTKPMGE